MINCQVSINVSNRNMSTSIILLERIFIANDVDIMILFETCFLFPRLCRGKKHGPIKVPKQRFLIKKITLKENVAKASTQIDIIFLYVFKCLLSQSFFSTVYYWLDFFVEMSNFELFEPAPVFF